MKKLIYLFCFLGTSCFSQVDSVIFCLSNKGVPGLYLSKLNVNTGVVTYISPSVIGNGVPANGAAIDPYRQVYYFFDGPYQIKTLDLLTGTIVTSASISNVSTDTFDQLIYNASDSVVYGLARTFSPPAVYLGKIDPNTGIVTKVSGTSLSQGELGWSATINPFTKIYYYVNESNVILGIDLKTGNIISSAPVTNVNGQYFDLMQFNAFDKIIYGLARKSSPAEVYLAKIDPLTGIATNISASPLSSAIVGTGSVLDPCNNNYYYIKESGFFTGANCSSGNTITPVVPSSQILEMKFNYKCYLNFTFSGIKENGALVDISFYPNPAQEILNISDSQNKFQNSEMEIMNYLGQTVFRSPYSNTIDVSKLSQGIYTLKIMTKENQSYYSKFMKE